MNLLCDGGHGHRELENPCPRTKVFLESATYPEQMVERIANLWKSEYVADKKTHEVQNVIAAAQQIEAEVVNAAEVENDAADDEGVSEQKRQQARALLTRLHKAAGHPSNRALARICRDRGMPRRIVNEALNLRCQACLDTRRGEQLIVPHSLGTKPQPWQMLGMDVMELVFPQQRRKARYLVAICLVMRLMMVEMLWEGPMNETGLDSGQHLAETFASGWLHHRPKPEWIMTDPQSSLAKGDFAEFCGWIGCGLTVTPGEAHWQNGGVESAIKAVKKTMRRIRNDAPEVTARACGHLAAAAQNNTDSVKGFSQWAYRSNPAAWNEHGDPLVINKNQGGRPEEFWQLQRWRSKAEEVHRQNLAMETMTRLQNASPRPVVDFRVGDWVCVWRNATLKARRARQGSEHVNPEPRFIGPGRVAMLEPPVLPEGRCSVVWVLMGTSLWRCAPEQLRLASEQEVITELLQKGEVVTQPVQNVLRSLKRFTDVTKGRPFRRG